MTLYDYVDPDHFDPSNMSFTESTTNSLLHVDFITQNSENANTAWSSFILNKSQGFTHPEIVRISDNIRTYVYTILGHKDKLAQLLLVVLVLLLMHKENFYFLQKQQLRPQ